MKNDRLFQIIYILLEKKMTTAPKLAAMLEVSVRTIYRDIDTLSISGIPVYTTAGKNGGISILPEYTFDKSFLSDKEQDEILFALQSLQVADQNVGMLLTKLGTIFKKSGKSWIEVDFSRWGHKKTDTVKFDTMKKAILEKRLLVITYANSYGEVTERDLKPIRLVFKSGNWYLQAFCLKADDFRIFKINRVLEIRLSDEFFEDEFQEIRPLEQTEARSENIVNLTLRFKAQAAYRVYEEFSKDDVEKQEDGSILVNAFWPLDNWIYGYLISFGTQVEILSPLFLKESLLNYVKKIEKHLIT